MSERRTLEPEAFAALDQKINSDKILSNAGRLFRDASFLMDAGGYASAVGLASIALEEVGKYLLKHWSSHDPLFSYDKHRLHVMKQCAVAALFLADSARREYKSRNINFKELGSVESLTELVRAIQAGLEREKSFANAARNKVLEMVKWSGLYYDEALAAKGIEPEKITESNARSVMENVSRAFMILADAKTVSVALHAFPFLHKTSLSPASELGRE